MNDTVTDHGTCFLYLYDRNRARDARGSVGENRFFVRKDLPNFSRDNTSDLRSMIFYFNFRRENFQISTREFSEPCRSLQGCIDPLLSVGTSVAGPRVTMVHGGQTAFTRAPVFGNVGAK